MSDIPLVAGPVLLFGGPYSNLQATQAMHQVCQEREIPPRNIICNGDTVAYCANPEETVSFIRDWGIHVVMGNCEESIGNQQDDCGCGFDEGSTCSVLSVEWYDYTMRRVSRENARWMKDLPRTLRFRLHDKSFTVIHGGVANISEFVFASSDNDKKRHDIEALDCQCIIGGHCGIPFGQRINDPSDTNGSPVFWLNTGVIGMPANDGTTDGWYMIIGDSPSGLTATWHRLCYDSNQPVQAMQAEQLCAPYQQGLVSGLWPSMDILPDQERQGRGKPLYVPPMLLD